MAEKLTGSELGLRKNMLGCKCGEIGKVFISNGSFFEGHFCGIAGVWTLRPLPDIPRFRLAELYEDLHHIGPV